MYALYIFLLVVVVINAYSTYPRRYSRDSSGRRCPEHCRCMTLNQRGTRGVLDTWGGEPISDRGFRYFSRGVSDEAARNGRSMVCQGLREIPSYIPHDLSKLTVYGDSSGRPSTTSRDNSGVSTQIQSIDRNSFRGSYRLREVIFSGNNIGVMYPYIFYYLRELKVLHLQNNNIRHLSAAVFHGLYNLHELRLSDNNIRFLPTPIFTYLRELKTLKLNGNKIRSIQRDIFKSLTKLETLDLSRNNITDLYDTVFDSNVQLQELYLSENRLWKLRPRWFKYLYKLKRLCLRGNMIKEIEPESFLNLHDLGELLLSANHIERIQSGAFRNLRNLKSLDISTNDITEVPTQCFMDLALLEELFIGNNKLTLIKNGTFVFSNNLRTLDLSRNAIIVIERESLHPLRAVQNIDLSHNKLRHIRKLMVYGLEELTDLNLAHNFIGRIDALAFLSSPGNKLSKLATLDIKSNNLKIISENTLGNLPQLKSLDISENRIKRLHDMAFSNLVNLRSLKLNKNRIRVLNKGLFSNQQQLKDLDLSGNFIRSLHEHLFAELLNLEDFDANNNVIDSLPNGVFRTLLNMTSLDLHGNKLLLFNFSMVANLAKLSLIDLNGNNLFSVLFPKRQELRLSDLILSKNHLKTISADVKNVMSSSAILEITGNPLSCDCDIQWMLDPMTSRQISVERIDDVICKSPDKHHGKKMTDLSLADVQCDAGNQTLSRRSLICDDISFVKRKWYADRKTRKAMIKNHVTILNAKNEPMANAVLLTDKWALAKGSSIKVIVQSTTPDDYKVRIGRQKSTKKIIRIFRHPLTSFGMHQYDVALIRLKDPKSDSLADDNPCLMTESQYHLISKILNRATITTRIRSRNSKLFTRLKPRNGRVKNTCTHSDFICTQIKKPNRKLMLVKGSPLYLGYSNSLRLAGIAMDINGADDFEYSFIPMWKISNWVTSVIEEYKTKCHTDRDGYELCNGLRLPSVSDMLKTVRRPERHK